ncbi:MAG: hypothetical protein ACRCUY_01455 [Thermoguttaceae bacterium]
MNTAGVQGRIPMPNKTRERIRIFFSHGGAGFTEDLFPPLCVLRASVRKINRQCGASHLLSGCY